MDQAATFILGWEEWVGLPLLGLPSLKVKIDTGAKTSALHARLIEPFTQNGIEHVRFKVHPVPRRAHQGWRYLADADAPRDLGEGEVAGEVMSGRLAGKLAKLGLI